MARRVHGAKNLESSEVRRPRNVQALDLQVPAALPTAVRNAAAAVGAKARGVCDVSDGRQDELVSTILVARVHRASV